MATALSLLVTPPVAGSYLAICVAGSPASNDLTGRVQLRVNGEMVTAPYVYAGQGYSVMLYPGDADITWVGVDVDPIVTQYALAILQVENERHVPPLVPTAAYNAVTPAHIQTPAYVSDLVHGVIIGIISTDLAFHDFLSGVPAGWTVEQSLYSGAGCAMIGYQVIPVPGANAATDWTSFDVTEATSSVVIPLYDLGLVVRPAVAISSVQGGQILTPGHVEPPEQILPFVPDVNPLPEPTPIRPVPLPPWIPGPQYRGDS